MDPAQVDPWWLVHLRLAGAALCGGIVRLIFKPASGETPAEALFKTAWLLFGCVTCGYFGTPVVMGWWEIDPSYSGAVGALVGFVGLSVAEGVLRAVDGFNIGNVLRFFIKDGAAK